MLPTFIIAGAGKSGTTSLWNYLSTHPEICMASIKEPLYFTRMGTSARYDKGLDWYMNLFKNCGGAKAIGEASPAYFNREDCPSLMHQTLPHVRLIFILRDPVERIYSQYWFLRQGGEALPDFTSLVRENHPKLERFIYNSSYQLHLNRFLEHYPREQMLVMLFDDMGLDIAAFLKKILFFIEVDPEFVPPNLERRYNPASISRFAWLQRTIRGLGTQLIRTDMPEWLFTLLKNTRSAIWRINTKPISYTPMPEDIRRQLVSEMTPTIDFIEEYLQRPLPAWRAC